VRTSADQLPALHLILRAGLELMRESTEPMGCGIFYFYKVFSRAFGEEEDGAGGSWSGRGDVVTTRFRNAGVHAAYPPPPDNHSRHGIKMAKEQGAYMLLTNCPPCTLFLEQGLELIWESGEHMEFGIFDFYRVFSRAFGDGEDGAAGTYNRKQRILLPTLDFADVKIRSISMIFENLVL